MNDAFRGRGRILGLLIVLFAGGLALTACQQATTAPVEPQPAVAGTEVTVPTLVPAVGSPTEAALPNPTGPTLTVVTNPKLGQILADAQGRTLYLFTDDTSMKSTCTGTCATNWPALTVTGEPVAGEGVDAAKLGTLTRDDGKTQVTYNSWPLYVFANDTNPGDANGQDMAGKWYVVSPAGDKVESPSS